MFEKSILQDIAEQNFLKYEVQYKSPKPVIVSTDAVLFCKNVKMVSPRVSNTTAEYLYQIVFKYRDKLKDNKIIIERTCNMHFNSICFF